MKRRNLALLMSVIMVASSLAVTADDFENEGLIEIGAIADTHGDEDLSDNESRDYEYVDDAYEGDNTQNSQDDSRLVLEAVESFENELYEEDLVSAEFTEDAFVGEDYVEDENELEIALEESEVKITLDFNGGYDRALPQAEWVSYNYFYNVGEIVRFDDLREIEKEGFLLVGWSYEKDGAVVYTPSISVFK